MKALNLITVYANAQVSKLFTKRLSVYNMWRNADGSSVLRLPVDVLVVFITELLNILSSLTKYRIAEMQYIASVNDPFNEEESICSSPTKYSTFKRLSRHFRHMAGIIDSHIRDGNVAPMFIRTPFSEFLSYFTVGDELTDLYLSKEPVLSFPFSDDNTTCAIYKTALPVLQKFYGFLEEAKPTYTQNFRSIEELWFRSGVNFRE